MTHSAWWLGCDALAVYRLARLVAVDDITDGFRRWLLERGKASARRRATATGNLPAGPGFYGWCWRLASCIWCVAVWVAVPVTAGTVLIPSVWQYGAFGLALAAAAGLIAERA